MIAELAPELDVSNEAFPFMAFRETTLANGTYNVSGLTLNVKGTASQPIYVRGASRTGVIIRDTSDAVLTWTVADEESPISSQSGCTAATVDADDDGTAFTCTATSAGGVATETVTLIVESTAENLLERSLTLVHRLPRTLAALESGLKKLLERVQGRMRAVLREMEAEEETDADVDNQRVGGMITLTFGDASQIIVNLQKPLQEVWLAARAGGFHYRWDGQGWLDTKGQGEFFADLSRYATEQAGRPLTFAQR